MEDVKETIGRIEAVIQRMRQKTKENGQATSHQNQNAQETLTTKDLSKAKVEEIDGNSLENPGKASCFKNKKREQSNTIRDSCPICEGTGVIIKSSSNYQPSVTFCKCRATDKTHALWKNSGIENEKNRLTFGSYKPYNNITEKAKETAGRYYKNFNNIRATRRGSIAFLGQVGSGKTHLSVAIGLNLLAKGTHVVYMSYRDEILKLKQNILDEDFYASSVRRYKLAEVLIIDDLFKGKINDSDVNIMFEIVNYRYMNNLPIIVSSEFTVEKLLYFDEGIGSRIFEMCKDYVVEMEGKENNYRVRS